MPPLVLILLTVLAIAGLSGLLIARRSAGSSSATGRPGERRQPMPGEDDGGDGLGLPLLGLAADDDLDEAHTHDADDNHGDDVHGDDVHGDDLPDVEADPSDDSGDDGD